MYQGTQPEFLLSNALFRMNGSAVLLSRDSGAVHGRPAPLWRIDHLERVHLGASDKAYNAIHLDDDQDNNLGVRLSRDLMKEAARGVELNLTTLAPKILPYHELVRTGLRMALRALSTSLFPPKKVSSTSRSSSLPSQPTDTKTQNHKDDKTVAKTTETAAAAADQDTSTPRPAPIIPNFKTAVDYWLIHAGGKAIITGIRDALNLTEDDVKPSRDVMYKYGNTSSASIWYELDEVEKASKVKNGQHALAIAIGSGIKVQTLYLTSVNRAK
jgi:3-ketoacyl-CoA synthase